jgi:uncharacterized protein YbaP (TraB family)
MSAYMTRIRLALGAGLLALILAACDEQVPIENSAAMVDVEAGQGPPIWQITGETGAVEGWLFGTVHALPDDFAWRSPTLDQTIRDADLLAVEVANLSDEDAMSDVFTKLAFDTPGAPLLSRVAPQWSEPLAKLAEQSEFSTSQLDSMESWAAALALAKDSGTAKSSNGVDRALLRRFEGRDVVELEGVAAQLSIFDRLPQSEQTDLLEAVISDSMQNTNDFELLIEAWQNGDAERLEILAKRGLLTDPELYEALLVSRNRDWTEQIDYLLGADERPLIAVGAGHMLGKDGLPTMLKERGYTIERIQ